ncbi:Variant SH3 domain/SH3 domain containing protein [Novymonas esmeraldas]|uniref:Variant SH3 domain/SH3 domain containing protein n=1 Tax=Novymonas esmeraldas TaxID=1808958 RepID=A0AAW0ESN5_9TRYP
MNALWRSYKESRRSTQKANTGAADAGDAVAHVSTEGDTRHQDFGGGGAVADGRATTGARSAEQCIALMDYDALNTDEISFKAGDVINVTGKGAASGFWEGYVAAPTTPALATVDLSDAERSSADSSRTSPRPPEQPPAASRTTCGLFPNCLVTSNMRAKHSLTQYAFQNMVLCLYAYTAAGDGEMSFAAGDVITAVRPSASPGWWFGVKSRGPPWTTPRLAKTSPSPSPSSSTVVAAAASARFADPAAASVEVRGAEAEQLFPTNFVTCDLVLVNFHFAGRQPHELSCDSGDIVHVHRRWNDGWWEGSLRGRRGIFPSNYTVPNISTTAPPLFCARCRSVFASNLFHSTCTTCAAEERVEDAMMGAMEAYVRGEAADFDLFAGVDLGLDTLSDESSGESGAMDSDADVVPSTGEGADRDARHETRRRQSRGSKTSWPARLSLLTERDVADLASNRVKAMD